MTLELNDGGTKPGNLTLELNDGGRKPVNCTMIIGRESCGYGFCLSDELFMTAVVRERWILSVLTLGKELVNVARETVDSVLIDTICVINLYVC